MTIDKQQKTISTPQELFETYEKIKNELGFFIMIGVPIPDDGRINFHCDMWINQQIANPNIIAHRYRSRFCSEGYHAILNNVLDNLPFITHVLLLDADEWPLDKNALQYMIQLNKDVVVGPTPIIKDGKGICWNMNKYSPYAEDFWIDFLNWDELPNEPFRINFSGGPWLIKREVLENIEYPFFKDVFTRHTRKKGQDIYFDDKVTEAGFEIWCEPRAKFNHERMCNLTRARQEQEKADTHGLPWGGFRIREKDWYFIKNIIDDLKPKNLLEFGSGLSTLLFSDNDIKVESFDEDLEHAKSRVNSRRRKDNVLLREWDGKKCNPKKDIYGLCFVDGPTGKANNGIGRKNSIKYASQYSNHVIIHDAEREDELTWQAKYLSPEFNLIRSNDKCAYWMRN